MSPARPTADADPGGLPGVTTDMPQDAPLGARGPTVGRPAHRILNAESAGYSQEAAALLVRAGDVRLEDLDRRALLDRISWATALIVRLRHRVDDDLLARAPDLKVVATATTGLDHLDLDAARRRGVTVLSLRGETEFLDTVHATAEHAWALLLALSRRIPWAHRHATTEPWDRDRFRGRELAGRALGVLGMGRIGRRVARCGLAFGMKVAGCDPSPADWPTDVERLPDPESLARRSDVLSVHVPLSPATRGLVNARVLAALAPGAVLVNTSRGAVVDEDALAAALESGALGGAALDVLAGETADGGPHRSRLLSLARDRTDVLVTPHVGGATFESMARTEVFMAEKLLRFCQAPSRPQSPSPS